MIQRAGTISVNRAFVKTGKTEKNEVLEEKMMVHEFASSPAEVGFSLGMTMNIGDFESVRLDISVKMPCYVEEVDDAYVYVQKWAEDRLKTERDAVDLWRNNSRKINPL